MTKFWIYTILGMVWTPILVSAINDDQKSDSFNEAAYLDQFLFLDQGDTVHVPQQGLDELARKIWRYHEFDTRYLERDELDMLFIENHLKHRDRRSAVVFVGKDMAVLVWLNEQTKRAYDVSKFFGRNIYRIRQIAEDHGFLVREVDAGFTNSNSLQTKKAARETASTDPDKNAQSYAEDLVHSNPLPKTPSKPARPTRYEFIFR